jgi:transglutaminase-like putative cysteine protease
MGVISGWGLIRRRSLWRAALPFGLILLYQTYYYVGRVSLDLYLAFYLLVSLLLAVWINLRERWENWLAIRAHVPPNVNYRLVMAGLIATVLVVSLAWAGPTLAYSNDFARFWSRMTQPWNSARDRLGNIVTNLRGGGIIAVSDFYGEELLLEAGDEASDQVVLEITPVSETLPAARIYWRSRTYNQYENGGWRRAPDFEQVLDPAEGDFPVPDYQSRELFEVRIAPISSAQRLLTVPPQPIWVSRTTNARVVRKSEQLVDVSALYADRVVMQGETYRARSLVATPTIRELRSAGDDYPDWVRDNYLEVPFSVTQRTRDLAEQIAGGYENAYDKAAAITSWLRSNLDYSRVTEPPPSDQDPIDWVLFDYQVAFCNYYASAEVIMLRSLGIPARLAVGFAQGYFEEPDAELAPERDEVFDLPQGIFVVREQDAHAWPEVYFPGFGWVEFEPTVSQAPLVRPENEEEQLDFANTLGGAWIAPGRGRLDRFNENLPLGEQSEANEQEAEVGVQLGFWQMSLIALLGLFGLGFIWMRVDIRSRLRALEGLSSGMRKVGVKPPKLIIRMQQVPATPIGQVYMRWSKWLPRLDLELNASQTPLERAEAFENGVPEERRAGWAIAQAYNRERFGRQPVKSEPVEEIWRDLRPRLWMRWLRRWVDLLFNGSEIRSSGADSGPRLSQISDSGARSYGAD